ncbi:DeoR family transcriptional regulator [Virgibacillus sp. MSJ-26]|uniref:DeoR family transcriptional regulator n=1 Tax=Virgibacillus sp. MSJ-26 TaxID=2841522 RepID=UPI001C102D99|nr:DeoR family transcriptional regulator [Virgibacillus sp. MSJ-26]MBU5465501.1 DeoR family transcriptional regulator [Virgibacillus sp. MSJ-26]
MLPVERQNRIKSLMQEREHMKISELSQELNVSEMTIHRDLKPLIDQEYVIKTFGGVTLSQHLQKSPPSQEVCVICQRDINERLAYRLILPNNQIEMACCAHCGLMRHRQLSGNVIQAICHDFLKHTTISAPDTWYVMDTSINIGCCQPQVLTFEQKNDAEKFIKGFGGQIYTFEEAVTAVHEKMDCPSCHQHE